MGVTEMIIAAAQGDMLEKYKQHIIDLLDDEYDKTINVDEKNGIAKARQLVGSDEFDIQSDN